MTFGTTSKGEPVHAVTLETEELQATIITLGAILQDIRLKGVDYPLTLGSPSVAPYEDSLFSFGSLVGPVANRIKHGRAIIAGQEFTFPPDTPEGHTLHMGSFGLHTKVWEITAQSKTSLTLDVTLPGGEAGLPGNRTITATYALNGPSLTLHITATTDAPTLFNIANHSYWNLDGTDSYAGHSLTIAADRYLVADALVMPTGEARDVTGTDYDFRQGQTLAADQTQFWDTNFCVSNTRQPLRPVATLKGTTGVTLDMASTEPGLQVFDGATIEGKTHPTLHGSPYTPFAGVALEAQSWPGATTFAHFPQIEHDAQTPYHQTTSWTLSR